ncbi:MAG: ACP S-malonyltransferase [Burkholderiaceae bacterium]
MTKLACVFPGQGSQSVGMLADFRTLPAVSSLFELADNALGEPHLSTLVSDGPAESLALTTNTQPAMLVAGLACYRAWLAAGGRAADMVAGHSLGEYTALVAANVLSDEAAIRLTRIRADAMQSAVPVGVGSMAAILGLGDDVVQRVCDEASDASKDSVVAPANFNAPAQVVIAGHADAVERACALAKENGAKRALPLAVSAPFHSALLKPAGDRLKAALESIELKPPAVPLINNVDVAVNQAPGDIVDALVRQAYSPVRWVECVRKMQDMGATHVIEFGPGKVLSGLVGRIDRSIKSVCVHDQASLDAALEIFA